jgi:type VI secretion system protein
MGLVIVLRSPGEPDEIHRFSSSPVRLGRSPLNNVCLATPFASGHHGVIYFDAQTARYIDLGSRNGTELLVEGRSLRAEASVPLEIVGGAQREATLRVGALEIEVRLEQAEAPAAPRPVKLETRLARPGLASRVMILPPAEPAAPGAPPADPAGAGYRMGATRAVDVRDFRASLLDPAPAAPAAPAAAPAPPPAASPSYRAGETRMVGILPPSPGDEPSTGGGDPPWPGGDPPWPAAPPAPASPSRGPSSLPPPGGDEEASLLDTLVQMATPRGARPPTFDADQRPFVEALVALVDAFARGLTELKRGYQDLGDEIGVRSLGGQAALHKSPSSLQMLAYLLDPAADKQERLEELVDLYADFMIHEVALLGGIREGVRALVAKLDPDQGYADAQAGAGAGVLGFLDRSLRRYKAHFDEVTEDGGERALFGRAFAQAYAEAMGAKREPGKR